MNDSDQKAHDLVAVMRVFCERVHACETGAMWTGGNGEFDLEWWVELIEKKIGEVDAASGLPSHGVKRTG